MKQSLSRNEKILQARVLKTLLDINKVDKILSTFIPAFKKALPHEGRNYLLGNFNLGGTVSGRLSSCLPSNVLVYSINGYMPLANIEIGTLVLTHKGNFHPVTAKIDNGVQDVYEVELSNGNTIVCTSNHRLLTEHGFKSIEGIYYETSRRRFPTTGISERTKVCLRTSLSDDGSSWVNRITTRVCCTPYQWGQVKQSTGKLGSSDSQWSPEDAPLLSHIRKIKYVGTERVYDLEVSTDHSFLANGIFVHNSKPNLQQIPSSGTPYAKAIKQCFSANEGWLMVGIDYNALEARIGALLTKDPAKLDIYLKGIDSHSFNAFSYWPDKFQSIQDALIWAKSLDKIYKVCTPDGNKYFSSKEEAQEYINSRGA